MLSEGWISERKHKDVRNEKNEVAVIPSSRRIRFLVQAYALDAIEAMAVRNF